MNDHITRNISEIQTGLKSLEDVNIGDVLFIILLAAAIIAGVYLLLNVAGRLIKVVIIIGITAVILFVLFGFDPMGLGSHILHYWERFTAQGW